jgi:hypothetical protein
VFILAPVKLVPDLAHWNGGPGYLHTGLGPFLIQKPVAALCPDQVCCARLCFNLIGQAERNRGTLKSYASDAAPLRSEPGQYRRPALS